MRYIVVFFILVFSFVANQAQNDDFVFKFVTAKSLLSEGNTSKAIPILQDLIKKQPENLNLHYLLGVCYTEEPIVTDKSIFHLEKSLKNVVLDYEPGSYNEKRTPIFVYYFLTIAYSQNHLCEKSKEAYHYFSSLYGEGRSDFYVFDAKKWADKCKEIPKKEEIKTIVPVVVAAKKIEQEETITTKKINYTTSSSLYGVQIGAFSKLVPVYKFQHVKNVEAFMDNNGMIRYVIGHFSFRKQAETLLEAVKEAGYPDAFIVDVNKEKKFSEEVVAYNNQSIKSKVSHAPLEYRVQIGAFKDSIPYELSKKYLVVEDIEEYKQGELTVLTSGRFRTYEEAVIHKSAMLAIEIPKAFIVRFQGDRKVVEDD